MGKKRRADAVDLDAERTLYTSFVSAANSMSQLYSQALQQQRKSSAAASRQALERVLGFLLRPEYAGTDVVPKAALLQFLQQEYENLEGELPHSFPIFPALGTHQAPGQQQEQQQHQASSQQHTSQQPELLKPTSGRHHHHHGHGHGAHGGSGLLSPAAKRANSGATSPFSAMDTADHEASTAVLPPGQALGPHHHLLGLGGATLSGLGVVGTAVGNAALHDGGRSGAVFGPAAFTAC